MARGVRLRVWGEYALFTRPEFKVERVSYDVMTPSAARGILEAIHWTRSITWVIDRIHVLNPIRFETIRRNEIGEALSAAEVEQAMALGDPSRLQICVDGQGKDGDLRQQRASTVLRDVDYVIAAHFKRGPAWDEADSDGKHLDQFKRRASAGGCFHRPYLGCREFPAHFQLIDHEATLPLPRDPDALTKRLGWMLYDLDYANGRTPIFFDAYLDKGVLDCRRESVRLAQ
jgi:CRISPR-associated protein Cas5d